MCDFTVKKYNRLLRGLLEQDYPFQTFHEFLEAPAHRSIVLRHDVDKRPRNSLVFARIERDLGLKGTYNFRAVPESWDVGIIREIASLGHEIGYHYENLATCGGDYDRAFEDFRRNLEKLRALVPVRTITMHGSPRSKHDSRELWKRYSYRELGIIGEPYLDVDFSKVLYLTDTGRRWDGSKVSIRDRVDPSMYLNLARSGHPIRSTDDIILAAKAGVLPGRIMINIHPQRWHQRPIPWLGELVFQNTKNLVKRAMVKLEQR
jgi:hypothetical protein